MHIVRPVQGQITTTSYLNEHTAEVRFPQLELGEELADPVSVFELVELLRRCEEIKDPFLINLKERNRDANFFNLALACKQLK